MLVTKEGMLWPKGECKRIAGVSSFGFSGTNAHLVVEEAPAAARQAAAIDPPPVHLLTLSAPSKPALETLAGKVEDYLTGHEDLPLSAISCTAGTGRAHFDHRLAVVGETHTEMRLGLEKWRAAGSLCPAKSDRSSDVVFLFTGQGSQYLNMGRQFYDSQPVFREAFERCAQLLEPYLEGPLTSALYPSESPLHSPDISRFAQPALFAFEYATAALWQSWGIEPAAVIGHSLGEYVAACVAGVFDLQDAARLIGERVRLIESLPANGMMAAVFTPEQTVLSAIQPVAAQASVAVVNGPNHTVVSGERTVIEALLEQFKSDGITTLPLPVSHAFHSPLMDPVLERFEAVAGQFAMHPSRIPMISNVTGQLVEPGQILDAAYWRRHLRRTVVFSRGSKHFITRDTDHSLRWGLIRSCATSGAHASGIRKRYGFPPRARTGSIGGRSSPVSATCMSGAQTSVGPSFTSHIPARLSHFPLTPFKGKSTGWTLTHIAARQRRALPNPRPFGKRRSLQAISGP